MMAAGQQRVIAEINSWDHVRGTERNLLGFREEVIGIAVQNHAAHRSDLYELLWNQLGRVQHIEAEAIRLLFRQDLDPELPLGIVARLDRFPQIPAMKIRITPGDLDGL